MRRDIRFLFLVMLVLASMVVLRPATRSSAASVPTVGSISPTQGPTQGGTTVTINGSNFDTTAANDTVFFGSNGVTPTSCTTGSCTATSPAGSAGPVSVTVKTTGGGTSTTSASFIYVGPPVISSLSLTSGSTLGGTTVLITGSNFSPNNTTVQFGPTLIAATSVNCTSNTNCTVTSPADSTAGPVNVSVTVTLPFSPAVSSTNSETFTYVPPPTVTALDPTNGPQTGSTTVVLTGTNFTQTGGTTTVNFVPQTPAGTTAGPANAATIAGGSCSSATSCTVTSPALAPASVSSSKVIADVIVTVQLTSDTSCTSGSNCGAPVPSAAVSADQFTYNPAPEVDLVVPHTGSSLGGTDVTITGKNFVGGAAVFIGPVGPCSPTPCAPFQGDPLASPTSVLSSTSIITTTPANLPGAVYVVVTNVDGQSGYLLDTCPATAGFCYTGTGPTLAASGAISPTSGPSLGGTPVTITGTNFDAGATVSFGGATSLTFTCSSTCPATDTITEKVIFSGAATAGQAQTLQTLTPNVGGGTIGPVSCIGATSPVTCTVALGTALASCPAATTCAQPSSFTATFPASAGLSFQSCSVGATPGGCNVASHNASVSSVTSTTILVTAPAHAPGAVDVIVTNPDGESVTASAGYTFNASPAPTLANGSVCPGSLPTTPACPTSGSSLGGTQVTVTGTNFASGATVTFAGANAAPVVVNNATTITVTTPAHASGLADVVVTNPDGQSVTATGGFTYSVSAPPGTPSITPNQGSINGGTQVTITGTNFVNGATATVGGNPLAPLPGSDSLTFVCSGSCTSGETIMESVNGSLTTAQGQTISAPGVGASPPTASCIASGGGATCTVTLNEAFSQNQSFTATLPAGSTFFTTCTVGATPGTCSLGGPPPVFVSATTFVGITSPFGGTPGLVNVVVTNPDGQQGTLANGFTYNTASPPTLAASTSCPGGAICPSTGPSTGGTPVTLTGANFVTGAVVTFNGFSPPRGATSVNSATQITTTTPAGLYATVTVRVTNPDGQHADLVNGFAYTLATAPTLAGSASCPGGAICPSSGPTAGGQSVTITGTNFVPGVNASIGGKALSQVNSSTPIFVNSTTIQGLTPANAAGAADVVVTNPDNQTAIAEFAYTYSSDTTPPTTVASFSTPANSAGWNNSSVTLTLTSTDNTGGSGVKQITYSASGAQSIASTTVTTNPAILPAITTAGTTTVSFFAQDNAGNVENPAKVATVKIDETAPPTFTASATIPSPGGGTIAYTSGTTTNENVTVIFTCTDNTGGSGVRTITASGNASGSSSSSPLSVTVTSSGTNQQVNGTCTDLAGNSSNTSFGSIDINSNALGIVASAVAGGKAYTGGTLANPDWTNQDVTVSFTCTPLPIANPPPINSVTSPVIVSTEGVAQSVSGTCTDTAGNSAATTFKTIDIDKTLPVVSVASAKTAGGSTYTSGVWTNQNVTVTFSCLDSATVPGAVSGVASVTPPITVSTEGSNQAVTGTCTDNAGNIAEPAAFFGQIDIDKTPPACSVLINPNPLTPANGNLDNVFASVIVTDVLSGPNGFTLVSVTSNSPSTASSDIQGFTTGAASIDGQLRATSGRIYTFTYQGADLAGNTATCTDTVTVTPSSGTPGPTATPTPTPTPTATPTATPSPTATAPAGGGGGGGGGAAVGGSGPAPTPSPPPSVTPTPPPTATPGPTRTGTPTPTATPGCATVTYAAGYNLAGGPNGTVLSGAGGSLFTFQAADTNYEVLPVSSSLSGGLGVWAFFFTPTTVTLPCVSGTSLTLGMPANHFIMVGNPFDKPAVVSGAQVIDTFNPSTNSYTTSSDSATLGVGQGAWVFTSKGGTFTISST